MFIDNNYDALAFSFLTVFIFIDFYVGNAMTFYEGAYKSWYAEYETLTWLPPRRIFPVVWTVLYVLIETGMYAFYKNMYPVEPEQSYVVPTIIVLFLVNMMLNKQWSNVFVVYRWTSVALLMTVLLDATGLVMLIIFGLNGRIIEVCTFVFYVAWCFFATYLTYQVYRAEERAKEQNTGVGQVGQPLNVHMTESF